VDRFRARGWVCDFVLCHCHVDHVFESRPIFWPRPALHVFVSTRSHRGKQIGAHNPRILDRDEYNVRTQASPRRTSGSSVRTVLECAMGAGGVSWNAPSDDFFGMYNSPFALVRCPSSLAVEGRERTYFWRETRREVEFSGLQGAKL
jgi:hypothetical protein